MRRIAQILVALLALSAASAQAAVDRSTYIPQIVQPGATALNSATPTVNVPQFSGTVPFAETAIFWFGKVEPNSNYADVRVGANATELYVHVTAFDRRLWYPTTPTAADLPTWDGASVYVSTGSATYRFDSALSWFEPRANYQAAYRNGSAAGLSFTTERGYRNDPNSPGAGFNDDNNDRGWTLTYHIPFSSLGLSAAPASSTLWRAAVVMHDRDSLTGPATDQTWPAGASLADPSGWGRLRFGLPTYTPPSASSTPTTVTIRHKLNGATVLDAGVGGASGNTTCKVDDDFWNTWGARNFNGTAADGIIQNQSDVGDWPCFAKYYVTFPLSQVPAGAKIVSAKLTLHQKGNSGTASNGQLPPASWTQIMLTDKDWDERTISWNNAPQMQENIARAKIDPIVGCGASGAGAIPWPCVPRSWDLSYGAAQALSAGQPLRLVVYAADSDYATGKYFTTSDTGDWNQTGRPTLEVTYRLP